MKLATVAAAIVSMSCSATTPEPVAPDASVPPEAASSAALAAETSGKAASAKPRAVAAILAKSGSSVTGTVTFTAVDGGVEVAAEVHGLTPGLHGFHVHEKGDCSAADGASAGGHWNPGGHDHGAREAEQRHVGDLGNLEANAEGKASATFIDRHLSLGEGTGSIVGKGLIIHANADDYKTQPTGNAGPRVGCGVIELKK